MHSFSVYKQAPISRSRVKTYTFVNERKMKRFQRSRSSYFARPSQNILKIPETWSKTWSPASTFPLKVSSPACFDLASPLHGWNYLRHPARKLWCAGHLWRIARPVVCWLHLLWWADKGEQTQRYKKTSVWTRAQYKTCYRGMSFSFSLLLCLITFICNRKLISFFYFF